MCPARTWTRLAAVAAAGGERRVPQEEMTDAVLLHSARTSQDVIFGSELR